MVGTARCAVPARSVALGGTRANTRVLAPHFRRLTLRSATGTALRAIPTADWGKVHPFRKKNNALRGRSALW
jgi:hypothetical protein